MGVYGDIFTGFKADCKKCCGFEIQSISGFAGIQGKGGRLITGGFQVGNLASLQGSGLGVRLTRVPFRVLGLAHTKTGAGASGCEIAIRPAERRCDVV